MNFNRACSTVTVELIDYIQQNPNTVYHMDQFLSRYENGIFNFIRLTVQDYHDSMDITNKVLLTLSRKVKEIRAKKAFNAMVLKVIRGEIGNYIRSKKSNKAQMLKQATIWHNDEQISLFETLQQDDGTAEEVFQLFVIRDLIENSCDEIAKQVFWLRYRDDESIENIAKKLEVTEYQVKKQLQEIQVKIAKHVEEGG